MPPTTRFVPKTPDFWPDAKAHLAKRDPVLRKLIKTYPDAVLGGRGDPFQTLARSIVGQQISVKAAQSVWGRFEQCAGTVTAGNILALPDEAIRACGFSGMKVAYVKDLASRFDSGTIQPKRWARMDDEAVIEDLIQVHGIGRWSVEMFLIFHEMRPDVLPVDDLGLRRAMERAYNDGEPMTKAQMREIGKRWQPYRSAATWYLWRSLDPVSF
jgi:DNA-3-methyladenine glycosylase II